MTPDVYAACDDLERNLVKFQKKPDEGRMKGLAFALDPDNYWIEIVSRGPSSPVKTKYSLAQTMLRVKNPTESLDFFCNKLKMNFHNHGTEYDDNFSYHNGNDQDGKWSGHLRGFGHIGYLVDDLDKACEELEASGVVFKKKPSDGTMRGLAFAYSPVDNYWIEIIQRKGLNMI